MADPQKPASEESLFAGFCRDKKGRAKNGRGGEAAGKIVLGSPRQAP
jgi:hypothetical protein